MKKITVCIFEYIVLAVLVWTLTFFVWQWFESLTILANERNELNVERNQLLKDIKTVLQNFEIEIEIE